MFYAKEKIAILPDSVCSKSLKSPSTLWIPQHHHLQEYHRHQAERDHHYAKIKIIIIAIKIITITKIKIIIIAKIKAHPPADGTDHNGAKSRSLAPRTRPAEYAIKPNAFVHHHHHHFLRHYYCRYHHQSSLPLKESQNKNDIQIEI